MGPVRALLDCTGALRGTLFACAVLLAGCAAPGASSSAFALISIEIRGEAPDLARVEQTLEALAGVIEIQVDARERRVDVAYDPARATRAQLLEAIQGLGYEAEAVFRRIAPVAPEEPPPEPEGASDGAG